MSNKNTIINKIETKILYILKSFGLLFLLFFFQAIPLIFLNININKLSNTNKIIYSLICDILLILIFIFIYRKDLIRDYKNYFNKNFKKNIKLSLKYWAIGLIIMIITNLIIGIITNGALASNEESVRELIDKSPLFMLFELMIYAPITEELIFRKSIKDIINDKKIYPIISGFIFGLLHIISSTNNPLTLLYIIPYGSLGYIFAKLYKKTDNIFSSITIHSIHNTLTLILYLILKTI